MAVHLLTSVLQDIRKATLQDAASLSDGKLLDHFIEHKDEAAFAALIQRHSGMVWGVCRRALPHHHDAEDAFQATFLVLARNANAVRKRELVANWLYGVAHRTALKARAMAEKRRTREKQVFNMPEPEAVQQDSSPELDALIDRELAGLPDKYRSAIVLCDLECKTGKVAARQLKIPEGTLASRLRTGRLLLAKRLARHGLFLSVGALATALSPHATAAMPAALLANTVKAATLIAAGNVAASTLVSAKVTALMEGAQKTMLLTKLKLGIVAILLAASAGLGSMLLTATASLDVAGDPPKQMDPLLKLSPAERMGALAKVVDKDKDFVSATRGPLTERIVERGSLYAVESTDLVYRGPTGGKSSVEAVTIKDVVGNGSRVKKGDPVIHFDPSGYLELLGKQKEVVVKAEAEQRRAAAALERIKSENRIDVKLAEIDVRLAELALRQYKGNDDLQKETLAVQVDRAALLLERVKLQGLPKLEKATDLLDAKKSACNAEWDRLRAIEKDITNCVMTAPQDGVAVYYVPERKDLLPIAVGEPVREGQKLLSISDLKQMAVSTRVPESLIASVRVGQAAKIQVDAFPNRTYAGKVSKVANVARQADWLKTGAKLYMVMISIDGENKALKPGMSAETTIVIGEQADCLRVPAMAVLGKGKETFCYVLAANELHVRKVTVGLSDGKLVEILTGLKNGDQVLRDPSAAIQRLNDALPPGKK
jgi:RND family efflux transporter MFP subunit